MRQLPLGPTVSVYLFTLLLFGCLCGSGDDTEEILADANKWISALDEDILASGLLTNAPGYVKSASRECKRLQDEQRDACIAKIREVVVRRGTEAASSLAAQAEMGDPPAPLAGKTLLRVIQTAEKEQLGEFASLEKTAQDAFQSVMLKHIEQALAEWDTKEARKMMEDLQETAPTTHRIVMTKLRQDIAEVEKKLPYRRVRQAIEQEDLDLAESLLYKLPDESDQQEQKKASLQKELNAARSTAVAGHPSGLKETRGSTRGKVAPKSRQSRSKTKGRNTVPGDQVSLTNFNQTNAEKYEKECSQGDLGRCAQLSNLLMQGTGVPQDQNRAVSLARKSCAGKNPHGCTLLGTAYLKGTGVTKDKTKGIGHLRAACLAGHRYGCTSGCLAGDTISCNALNK